MKVEKKYQRLLTALVIGNLGLIMLIVGLTWGTDIVQAIGWHKPSAPQNIPQTMNYQGSLTDDSGTPINGTRDMTFRIYETETDVAALWTETHSTVEVSEGIFNVQLGSQGSVITSGLFSEATRWIEIEVDGVTLTPRQQLGSVPYAFNAERLNGKTENELLSNASGLPNGAIVYSENPSDTNLLNAGFSRIDTPGRDISTWTAIPRKDLEYVTLIGDQLIGSGWRYSLTSRSWMTISMNGAPTHNCQAPTVVADGKMAVWGGGRRTCMTNEGSIYDPSTDAWTPIDQATAPISRADHILVWTGSKLIAWGGCIEWDWSGTYTNTGGVYDPSTDTWTEISSDGAPMSDGSTVGVWNGAEMLVWTGYHGGASYDPVADSWSSITTTGAPPNNDFTGVRWNADLIIVGSGIFGVRPSFHRYNSATDTWQPLGMKNAPDGQISWMFAVPVGRKIYVYGGKLYNESAAGGSVYDMDKGKWTAELSPKYGRLSNARSDHTHNNTAFWSGSEIVIWDFDKGGVRFHPRFIYPYIKN